MYSEALVHYLIILEYSSCAILLNLIFIQSDLFKFK